MDYVDGHIIITCLLLLDNRNIRGPMKRNVCESFIAVIVRCPYYILYIRLHFTLFNELYQTVMQMKIFNERIDTILNSSQSWNNLL